ncbi:hypothetical protein ACOSQ4_019943 [Xanthoceras sorbifolium]
MPLCYSTILLFLLLNYTEAKTNHGGNNNSQNQPWWPQNQISLKLKTQPVFCGLEGFELSCFNNNTLLQIPSSSSNSSHAFYVQEISYLHRVVTIIDAGETKCPLKTLLSLNITDSKFAFIYSWYSSSSISIVNCTEKIAERSSLYEEVGPIDCTSYDKNFVYVIGADERMDMLPSNCSISRTTYIPVRSDLNDTVMNFLETRRMVMAWEDIGRCYGCEKSGNFCGFNLFANSTICVKNKDPLPISIIVGTSIGGSIFFTLVILIVYKSIKSDKEKEVLLVLEKFLEEYKTLNPTRYTYSDLKKITDKFKHKFGQGGYGSVYKGKLSYDFINEVAVIGRIHHFNIVCLLGFCSEGTRRAIIYEFMFNGWEKLQNIAFGVARGIEYLRQGCKQRILHFDIKPHNVLLEHNFQPKILDFGLAKLCSKDISIVSMTAARGNVGYIAPELYSRNFGEVSYKSDVFSYGMMLLEMVGCRKNNDFTVENQSQVYFPKWVYSRCIQWNSIDRPSITMVMQMLEGDLHCLEIPPNKPFDSSDIEMVQNS